MIEIQECSIVQFCRLKSRDGLPRKAASLRAIGASITKRLQVPDKHTGHTWQTHAVLDTSVGLLKLDGVAAVAGVACEQSRESRSAEPLFSARHQWNE